MAPVFACLFELLLFIDLRCYSRIRQANSVAESVRGSNPDVIALKIDRKNVVVGGSGLDWYLLHSSSRVANQHLGFMSIESGTIDRPIGAVVVGQSLVG